MLATIGVLVVGFCFGMDALLKGDKGGCLTIFCVCLSLIFVGFLLLMGVAL